MGRTPPTITTYYCIYYQGPLGGGNINPVLQMCTLKIKGTTFFLVWDFPSGELCLLFK